MANVIVAHSSALRNTLGQPDHCNRVGVDVRRVKQEKIAG
ncbi:hypothetical protein ABIA95_004222 [Bradyrhizobium sp. LA8.1]